MDTSQKSLKGQLILDNGKLRGSFFHRTVILICQHDSEGAFGLVLNRSTKNKVGEAVVANLPDTLKEETLFLGGPVQPQALSYLHNDAYLPDANVLTNLGLDLEVIRQTVESMVAAPGSTLTLDRKSVV